MAQAWRMQLSERAVVEEDSVNKYQYACSSVNNNCIKPDVYTVY